MFPAKVARAAGTGASVPVECCQVCGHAPLETVLSLGYMPPVNQMVPIGQVPRQQPWFPTDLLYCAKCELVQLGLAVDPVIIFPPEYPYTSGTTKLLRDNFADLCAESGAMLKLTPQDLVIDIGSNDGTLISNFQKAGYRVLGIEPTEVGKIAAGRGIPTLTRYFTPAVAAEVKREHGPARVVDGGELLRAYRGRAFDRRRHHRPARAQRRLHFGIALPDRAARYLPVRHRLSRAPALLFARRASSHLLGMHGLEVFHARPIPSHGGSIRVYAARRGVMPIQASVAQMLAAEPRGDAMRARLKAFRNDVLLSKLRLMSLVRDYKEKGARICGISAPSRASTLFNYVGLDDGIIDYVCEIAGSLKIGKCMPGTSIPVVEESRLFSDQPEVAIIFSWHIADELAPKLRAKGYRGKLVTPLPVPREL